MKNKIHFLLIVLATLAGAHMATAQGTAFTYQGRLNDGANTASGNYDLRFALFNDPVAGAQQGNVVTNVATVVSNGLFAVTLDFGNQFPGADRWLEIGVRTNGPSAFSTLVPRQKLTPAPYAITAGNLSGVLSGAQIAAGSIGAAQINNAEVQARVTGTAPAGQFITGVAANGTVTVASDTTGWKLGGNNVAPGQFLGSTNSQPVEIRANGTRALRIEPNTSGAPNIIGGGSLNYVAPGIVGSFIGGGGATNYNTGTLLAGYSQSNSVSADFGTVAGGDVNSVQLGSTYSAIVGGLGNQIQPGSANSFIGGGYQNTIQSNQVSVVLAGGDQNTIESQSPFSVIGGGGINTIHSSAPSSVISGGEGNTVSLSSHHAAIGGGQGNTVVYPFTHATIGGGHDNTAAGYYAVIGGGDQNQTGEQGAVVGGGQMNIASAFDSTVAGGDGNHAAGTGSFIGGGSINNASGYGSMVGGGSQNSSSGRYSAIPGGNLNFATGTNSFAAGQRASSLHNGTFVWSDLQASQFVSTSTNQFLVRAGGGVGINTNSPGATLDVNGSLRVGAGTTVFKNLQGGLAQMATGSSTVKTNFTFSFPKAFSGTPNVIVSARSVNNIQVDDTFAVTVRVVTATSCTVNVVRVDNPSGWSQQLVVNWLAWE